MSTDKFRKKPVVIEAFQLPAAGDNDTEPFLAWAEKVGFENWNSARDEGLDIETFEGVMRADPGDWVIKGVKGEFYPCKPDIFAATYEPADSSPRYEFDAPALGIAQKIMECLATAAVDGWPDDRLKAAIQCLVIEAMKWAAPEPHHNGMMHLSQELADVKRKLASVPRVLSDVIAERQRQADKGYTADHDDEHVCDEIAAMAAYYIMPEACRDWPTEETGYGDTLGKAIIPEGWPAPSNPRWRRDDLIKGIAMAVAEVERLDRAEPPVPGGEHA